DEADLLSRRDLLLGINAALLALSTGSAMPALARNTSSSPTGTHHVHEIENTWIPMPDGVKLAARIWLPDNARQHPVPAIFNYCPYFARLFTRPDDDAIFPYYASHGYACVRVDIRGSGNSQGRPLDEYVQQEQDDGVEIIQWIASQPWCSGAVGIFLLAVMLLASGVRINRALAWDGDYGIVRFAIFLAALLANYTESNFAWMTPIGFLFLIAAIGHAEAASIVHQVDSPIDAAPEFMEEDIQAGGPAISNHR
ncbi:MAG: CocE/NonD family hydrolase, partial [Verrucomicrobiota bacterium]